jgi:ATP adenylyltransferase
MSGYFLNFDKFEYVRGRRYEGCILCGLVDGREELVDLTVTRSRSFSVSVNLYPYNPGHIMIYPLRHITDVRQLTAGEAAELHSLQHLFMDVLDELQQPAGYNLGYNMGGSAGGSIDHLHLHIIPRYQREVGIADLIAGKRVLVESPDDTRKRLTGCLQNSPVFAQRLDDLK